MLLAGSGLAQSLRTPRRATLGAQRHIDRLKRQYPNGGLHLNANDGAIGWGTLTLINAGLAQGKGRSGLAWWLLSLLLGPIATFLIVVLPIPVLARPTSMSPDREVRQGPLT